MACALPFSAERQRDVARQSQVRQQVVCLENETHARATQPRAGFFVETREIAALEQEFTRIGNVQPGDQVQQRRLANAGLADDRDVFAGDERQRDVLQDCTTAGSAKRLGQSTYLQHDCYRRPWAPADSLESAGGDFVRNNSESIATP